MRLVPLLAAIAIASASAYTQTRPEAAQGDNSSRATPAQRAAAARIDAPAAPLSGMARLGERMFFDPSLSGSGRMSCSTCHDPAHAYAQDNGLPVQLGGSELRLQGIRAVPTLTYLERTPRFRVRLDSPSDPDERRLPKASRTASASQASVEITPGGYLNPLHGEPVVPEGGMDWDGRASTLADQPSGPLMNPREMANKSDVDLLARLKAAPYAGDFTAVFGADALSSPKSGLDDMYLALARFMTEDHSFHAYNSKFDYYLAGRVQLTAQELRGLQLFDDPNKGNCAACHLDKPTKNRLPPVFTDYEFEALAVPRNRHLSVNRDPAFFDEGLCGPLRKDMETHGNCGLFKTPTLRNVATRQVFFHNGAVHSLEDAVRFYVERETRPEKWYPRRADGTVVMYDDLPAGHRAGVDVKDAPFNRRRGEEPALKEQEIKDMAAFLKTLSDGYRPTTRDAVAGEPGATGKR